MTNDSDNRVLILKSRNCGGKRSIAEHLKQLQDAGIDISNYVVASCKGIMPAEDYLAGKDNWQEPERRGAVIDMPEHLKTRESVLNFMHEYLGNFDNIKPTVVPDKSLPICILSTTNGSNDWLHKMRQ